MYIASFSPFYSCFFFHYIPFLLSCMLYIVFHVPDCPPFGIEIRSCPLEWVWQSVCELECGWAGSQQGASGSVTHT